LAGFIAWRTVSLEIGTAFTTGAEDTAGAALADAADEVVFFRQADAPPAAATATTTEMAVVTTEVAARLGFRTRPVTDRAIAR
jgi:hypothetical protein